MTVLEHVKMARYSKLTYGLVGAFFGTAKRHREEAESEEKAYHLLKMMGVDQFADQIVVNLPYGAQRRVEMARALAMEPKVLLMDEPFGALDSLTRTHMQDSLMEIQARLNNTVIMITHDVDEAVLLSDRIVMMSNGPSATIGRILDVDLLRPRNRLDLAEDPDYNHYRAEVVKFLHERHEKPRLVAAKPAPKVDQPELPLAANA
jgi:nitrate/nitrite transport system ATP-binding protein